jgi:hypothetical protein
MPKRYKKDVFIETIEFTNEPFNHQAIIEFAGLPISVEYTSDGVQLRVIRGAYSVLIAKLGEHLVKETDGSLRVCSKAALEAEYELVE